MDLEWKPPVHHDLGDGECAFFYCSASGSPFHVVFTLEVASFKTLKIKGYENLFFHCDVAQKRNRVGTVRMTEQIGTQREKSPLGGSAECVPASDGQHADRRVEDSQGERCRVGGEFPPKV